MKINIAYAPDDKYINQTVVSMMSAVQNNKDNEVEFIILYSLLSDANIAKLHSVPDSKIRMVKMDESVFDKLPLSHWVTVQAWFRIMLPDICKDLDKILYLDCDTLILGNLQELFELDLTGKYLAGVKDVWGVEKYTKRLSMESDVYINSGMILFNCDFCRQQNFFEKVVEFANNNSKIIEFCDQDSINKIADTQKIVLNPKYNFMDTWWRNGYYEFEGDEEKEYLQAKQNPVIVHLTGRKPAFKGCGNAFKDEWWKYAKLTDIYNELVEDYENSELPKEKTSILKQIFSIKNEYNGKQKKKAITILGIKFII